MNREERIQERRMRFKAMAGMMDFIGVIVGAIAIVALLALLVSLVSWLVGDLTQSFAALQKSVTEALIVQ